MPRPRVGSKAERSEILEYLTRRLIATECRDIGILTAVDALCRRTWGDIAPGWIRWHFYIEGVLGGPEAYDRWSRDNCERWEP